MMVFVGWDLLHRPIFYSSFKYADPTERCKNISGSLSHQIEAFEHATRHLMAEGVQQWVSVVDFHTYSLIKDAPSRVASESVKILQEHYPERLGLQILVEPPTAFWYAWKALSLLIDDKTKGKVKMVQIDNKSKNEDDMDTLFGQLFPSHVSQYLGTTLRDNKKKK